MPSELATIADPEFLLLAWSAGLAVVVAFVAMARIVGAGFSWLAAGVAFVIALPGALSAGAWWAKTGIVFLALGLLWARNQSFAGALFGIGGVFLMIEAAGLGGPVLAATAGLTLGGVTGEMALGHWYLVDPRLPRWALRSLAIVAIAGMTLDSISVWLGVGFPPGGGQTAFWMLALTSVVLLVAVLGALRYPAYSGVMAATGLSYLAVLTTLGAVFVGRALAVGLGPFAS